MSCIHAKCEYRVNRNGDPCEFGTYCAHKEDTVNRYDGQPQCPYHKDAIPRNEYENPQKEIDLDFDFEEDHRQGWYNT